MVPPFGQLVLGCVRKLVEQEHGRKTVKQHSSSMVPTFVPALTSWRFEPEVCDKQAPSYPKLIFGHRVYHSNRKQSRRTSHKSESWALEQASDRYCSLEKTAVLLKTGETLSF